MGYATDSGESYSGRISPKVYSMAAGHIPVGINWTMIMMKCLIIVHLCYTREKYVMTKNSLRMCNRDNKMLV